jgi:hypothetical protein
MSSAVVNTQVSPSQSASSGGGGAGSVAVAPSGINATPLGFSIRSSGSNASGPVIVSSPAIQLQLHVNPATVRGYAASLDPLFVNAIILPLNASGEASFTLPNKAGTYTVYLKYFSTTGQISPVVSQTLIYAPVETASSIQPAQHASSSGAQGTNVAPIFTRVLRQGDRGADVKALQLFLNTHGFIVAKKGEGSRGHETTFFGPATVKALKKFQEAQKDAILKPYNLEKGSGVFGAKTMAYINAIR